MKQMLSAFYTLLLGVLTAGFLFMALIALLTITLGVLGGEWDVIGVGVVAAVVCGFVVRHFCNKFLNRMAPPDDTA